jgi:sRNA-binding carbon storage regulator CsrA
MKQINNIKLFRKNIYQSIKTQIEGASVNSKLTKKKLHFI